MPANINHDITPIPGWTIDGRYWVRDSDGLRVPIIQGGGKAVPVMRAPWAFGDDDGSESGHTLDTEGVDRDTAGSGAQAADTPFLIRMGIAETAGGTQNTGYALFADKNSSGTFTEVTTSRTDGLRIANDTQSRADDESTTERLTAGGGTFVAGKYDDGQTQQGTTAFSMVSQYSEVEFCIEIDSANASTGDVWELRVEETGGTDLASYPATLPFVEAATITQSLTVNDIAHSNTLDSPAVAPPFSEISIQFEGGDKSEFDSETGATYMTVSTGAALVGTYGLENDATGAAGADFHGHNTISAPPGNGSIYISCNVDPNTLSMTAGDVMEVVTIRTDGTVGAVSTLTRLTIRNNGGTMQVQAVSENDAGTSATVTATMPGTPFHMELHNWRASSAVASDGGHELWLNGTSQGSDVAEDNYDNWAVMTEVRTGGEGIDVGTTGVFYLDNIIVSDTYQGPPTGAPTLTVADIAHANALDTPTLTSHQVIGTVNDIAHSNALDAVTLTSHQVIATVNEIAHDNILDGDLALTAGVSVNSNGITHENILDGVILTSHQVIPLVNEILHDNTLDAVTLTSHQVIPLVNEIDHSNTLDAVVLTSGTGITADSITHSNTLDAVGLTSHQVIPLVSDLQHDNILDAASPLVTHNALSVNEITHSNTLDSPELTFSAAGALNAQEVTHTNTLDAVELTFTPASVSLTVDQIDHSNSLDSVVLTSHNSLTVAEVTHANALDATVLSFTPHYVLSLNDVLHGNTLDGLVLTHVPPPVALTVEDCIHTHILDGQRFGGVVVSFMHDHDDFFIFMI